MEIWFLYPHHFLSNIFNALQESSKKWWRYVFASSPLFIQYIQRFSLMWWRYSCFLGLENIDFKNVHRNEHFRFSPCSFLCTFFILTMVYRFCGISPPHWRKRALNNEKKGWRYVFYISTTSPPYLHHITQKVTSFLCFVYFFVF